MKNILFPTDFSDAANKAYIYALHLASKWKATITTLHVYQQPQVKSMTLPHTLEEFYNTFDLYEFESYRDSLPELDEIAEKNGFGHVDIQHVLEKGKTKEKIVEVAQREKADLIIMGTTGIGGLKGIFLGSVAAKMLVNAPCPVMAVPKENSFDGKINKIAFTISYREEEKKALGLVANLFSPFDPEIHCINVNKNHVQNINQPLDKWKEGIAVKGKLSYQVLEGKNMYEVITNYMVGHRMDLIAMVTHQRKWIQELFNYSHAKKMAYHSEVPILALPEEVVG